MTYEQAPPALVKKDLQDFFSAYVISLSFAISPAANTAKRLAIPHYHALIFGQDFRNVGDGVINISDELYSNQVLARAWGHGMVSAADINMPTCCYVAGYVHKKIGDEDTFTLMSRRQVLVLTGWLNIRMI